MKEAKPLFGIIGGMGPISSAEFVHYVYSQAAEKYNNEDQYPRMVLISDPKAPNRLVSYQQYQFADLRDYLHSTIAKLTSFKVDKIIVCCIVAHACLPLLEADSKEKMVDLLDLFQSTLKQQKKKVLLFSTLMLHELQLIRDPNIIYLRESDARLVHVSIYKIKAAPNTIEITSFIRMIERMLREYNLDTIALACSDLHMINRYIKQHKLLITFNIIDILDVAADYILADGDY